ncbi:hypothetical protein BH23CHL5_BH23CHL5_09200 [soil metagenome]
MHGAPPTQISPNQFTSERDMPKSSSSFGRALRRYRTVAGLSQEALAEQSGLSVRGISDLERGERTTPRLETVRMIADALALGEQDRTLLLAAARPEVAPASLERPVASA